MSKAALSRRVIALEASRTTDHPAFTPAWARARVAELRAQGREEDRTPSECGGLFSPNQLCRMVDVMKREDL